MYLKYKKLNEKTNKKTIFYYIDTKDYFAIPIGIHKNFKECISHYFEKLDDPDCVDTIYCNLSRGHKAEEYSSEVRFTKTIECYSKVNFTTILSTVAPDFYFEEITQEEYLENIQQKGDEICTSK